MRYTYEDLPTGKLYVDGVYVPKGIWFDTDTGEYEYYRVNALGGLIYDEVTRGAVKERGRGKCFRFVSADGTGEMNWVVGVTRREGIFTPLFDTEEALNVWREKCRAMLPAVPFAVMESYPLEQLSLQASAAFLSAVMDEYEALPEPDAVVRAEK